MQSIAIILLMEGAMNLDNIINKSLQHTQYKDIKPRKKQVRTKEQVQKQQTRFIIRKIKTGDFNPNLKSHQFALSYAVKAGYVDRKTLTILKED